MAPPAYLVTSTADLPPWTRLTGPRLTQCRSWLEDMRLTGNFPIHVRKLLDEDLAAKANIVVHYLHRWDAANNGQLEAFKAKVPDLFRFISKSSRVSTRNLVMSKLGDLKCLDDWVEKWISAQSEGTVSPPLLSDGFDQGREDIRAQTESVRDAITTWKDANAEERHAAVVLVWVASTREMCFGIMSVLCRCRVIDASGPVYHEANTFLNSVQQLLQHCNGADVEQAW
ncbi:hypothetical protein F5X68DRAFT_231514 [Plectosphaerella plurivora]|uniref:Uncharacterized protein n=1 Tax=Plectosphaerella plurivora TaxID=936078 RepID=A0A9P8VEL1_9PEZI|nr:hypothetical protein F5X68DRAFT_231514 [Plectosphaerella plurivora]